MSHDSIRKPNEKGSHLNEYRSTYYHITIDSHDVFQRFIHEFCEGTTLDYDLATGGRQRPRRGKGLIQAVRLA